MLNTRAKEVVLVGATVGTLSAAESVFAWFTATPSWVATQLIAVGSVILAIVAVSVMALSLSLLRSQLYLLLIGLLMLTTIIVGGMKLAAVLGAVVLAGCGLIAWRQLQHEMTNRLSYEPATMYWRSARLLLLGMSVVALALNYDSLVEKVEERGVELTQRQSDAALAPVLPIVARMLPGFDPEQTLNEFIVTQAKKEAEALPPNITIAPESNQLAIGQLSQQFGLPLNGHQTMGEIIQLFINQQLRSVGQVHPQLVTLVLLIIALLLFQTATPLLVWPTVGLIRVLTSILRQVQFVIWEKLTVVRQQPRL